MELDIRLKEVRERRKISLNQCVRDTGIPKRTLKRYENGDITISMEYMLTLADYYDVSMDDFFGRESKKKHKEMER